MYNERVTTFHTLKQLHQQEQRVHRSHAIQNLVLVVIMLMGGAWLVCDINSACSAEKPFNDTTSDDTSLTSAPATGGPQSEAPDDGDAGNVKWLKNYDQALARAKKLNRPVLIDFAASWCVPCVMMDKHVWPNGAVQESLDSKVVALRIDMDGKSAPPLIKKYEIEFVPTILLIDADGKELKRNGFVSADELLEMIKSLSDCDASASNFPVNPSLTRRMMSEGFNSGPRI